MLNDLGGSEWIKFTKSWFVLSGKVDREKTSVHPATFPLELPHAFVEFFTKKGQHVLDPFSGTGTTLVAADHLERRASGIDIEHKFVEFSQTRTASSVYTGDALTLLQDPTIFPDESVDYIFTSPPYMNALHKSRGGNKDTRHKIRQGNGEPLTYSNHDADLGNVDGSEEYVSKLIGIFLAAHRVLKDRAYCTVVLQNLNANGGNIPIAWRFGLAMAETGLWDMKGERIWCQENKKLGIYGYPSAYATNNFHHYCLTFRKGNK